MLSPEQRKWQRHWHEVFDAALGPDGPPGEPLPDDIDTDFRLQFELWDLPAEARARAFSVFPNAAGMLARIDAHRSAPPSAIDADEATRILRDGLKLLRRLGIESPEPDAAVAVLDTGKVSLHDAFSKADSPFIELHDALHDMALRETGEAGKDAYFFLSEPLYRLAASYAVAHWICWPLCAQPGAPDATEAEYRLWRGGWSAGWSEEGVFLFDRREEFGLTG
ncbi:hypothetical protein EJP69_12570 [Variovorax gossypii]|uniref:Uncharacterized protein n=1 Tax=Variovorax gossypii TaxID=1679495 RepID=A0A3S0JXA4_9BURK|nr:hypothetical protein [Variovorax gossypii]RTQ35212.1 hypothetical protein EJP69_12570 [Variovorax gossypii]